MIDQMRLERGLWWDRAWSLVDGCSPVSESCQNCWAARQLHQLEFTTGREWTGEVVPRYDRLDIPLKRKKPTVWAVWNDLFHENVQVAFIYPKVIQIIRACPQHVFLICTKRIERAANIFNNILPGMKNNWPKNMWIGMTAENQQWLDERIEHLLRIPGKKFLSIEPMLGELNPRPYLKGEWYCHHCRMYFLNSGGKEICSNCDCIIDVDPYRINCQECGSQDWDATCPQCGNHSINGYPSFASADVIPVDDLPPAIDWVICGCESGPRRRFTPLDHFRNLRDQCQAAGVPFFLKQIGEREDGSGKLLKGVDAKLDGVSYLELPEG